MIFFFWRSVDDIVTLPNFRKKLVNFLGRILQVIIHSNYYFTSGGPYTAQQRVVLPIVSGQLNSSYSAIPQRQ
ncbi:hypothetical protein ASE28_19915 [Acidovorax sp. Root219]|nr:hypothetical protein ASE28_19915 [Acidovorax sp. Root219]